MVGRAIMFEYAWLAFALLLAGSICVWCAVCWPCGALRPAVVPELEPVFQPLNRAVDAVVA